MNREEKLAIEAVGLNELGKFICFNHGRARAALEYLRQEMAESLKELEKKGFNIPTSDKP